MGDMGKAFRAGLSKERRGYKPIDQIIAEYPDGVTLVGFGMYRGKEEEFPVFDIGEEFTSIAAQSGDLGKTKDNLLAESDGDIEAVNEWLAQNRPKVKIQKVPTRKKKPYVQAIMIVEAQNGEGKVCGAGVVRDNNGVVGDIGG